jgi:NADPH:quinone reductase-like Zn-dependent oxidoreductase
MSDQMKAVICPKYGNPDVLRVTQIDRPVPKEDEVLVKIYATSVTAAQCAMRTGKPYYGRLFIGLIKPRISIPGTDLSGEVIETGITVSKFKKGDKIFASSDLKGSSYAEYICLSENDVMVHKPDNMSHPQATSVLDGATTALAFLRDVGKLKHGARILINGASGGIGTFAVQLAKHFGANVTGVCSTKNVEMVKSLGADEVIDYTKSDFAKNENAYDIIFDTVGKRSFKDCRRSLKKGGLYLTPVLGLSVLIKMMLTSVAGNKKVKFAATGLRKTEEKINDLRFLKELIESGNLITIIDRQFTLDQIVEAHTYVEAGHKRGNVIIKLADND